MSNAQTIFLNGRRYDALTGKLLQDDQNEHASSNRTSVSYMTQQPGSQRSVEGFMQAGFYHKPGSKLPKQVKLSTAKKTVHHNIAPHLNRLNERSKTLMRDAVKHPGVLKIKGSSQTAGKYVNQTMLKSMAATAPAKTAVVNRARAIRRSDFVNRASQYTKPAKPVLPDPDTIQTTANSEVHLKNLDQLAQIESNPATDKIFSEAALKLIDSHQPVPLKEVRFYEKLADKLRLSVKSLFILCMFFLVVVFGSVSSYIFFNNLAMYVADNRTNIHGLLPTYKPLGFSLQSIGYATGSPTGSIKLSYVSNKNQSSTYVLQEQASTWDNQELIDSVVQPAVGVNFKTYQVGGRSLFIYDDSAVWVTGGIYYFLVDSAGLSTSQVAPIANST